MPSPLRLGREERLEGLRDRLRRHADAGVAHGDHDILTRRNLVVASVHNPRRERCSPVSIVSLPPSGMASRALTARLRIALSSWLGSTRVRHRPARQHGLDRDVLTERAAQQI